LIPVAKNLFLERYGYEEILQQTYPRIAICLSRRNTEL
jgi:hypothetical protein